MKMMNLAEEKVAAKNKIERENGLQGGDGMKQRSPWSTSVTACQLASLMIMQKSLPDSAVSIKSTIKAQSQGIQCHRQMISGQNICAHIYHDALVGMLPP